MQQSLDLRGAGPDDITVLPDTGLRPWAVALGGERVRLGPVPAPVLADAILAAHGLLRARR